MNIYGIGRAIVDYYVEGSIDDGFMEAAFSRLHDRLLPSKMGFPLHVEGEAFSFVLESMAGLSQCRLLRETGGTCVNILKTIATLPQKDKEPAPCHGNKSPGCRFSGTIGTRPQAPFHGNLSDQDFFQQQLSDYGIALHLRQHSGATGRCLVLPGCTKASPMNLPRQSWLALASPAVATEILPEQIEWNWLAECQWLVVEGMELDKDWFDQLLHQFQGKLVLACGTPFGAAKTAVRIKELAGTGKPVLVLANDVEARLLEQHGIDIGETSRKEPIRFIITHGCGGSSAYCDGERLFVSAHPTVHCLDATGAGDVFGGAFLSRLPDGESWPAQEDIIAAMEYASHAAAKIIQVPLCQAHLLTQGIQKAPDLPF